VLLTESAVEKSSFILTLHTRAQNSGTPRFSFFLFSLGPPACSAREKESRRFFESRVGRVGRVDQKKGGCDARIFVSSSQSALDWNAIFRSRKTARKGKGFANCVDAKTSNPKGRSTFRERSARVVRFRGGRVERAVASARAISISRDNSVIDGVDVTALGCNKGDGCPSIFRLFFWLLTAQK
jgi:hypothetical protein